CGFSWYNLIPTRKTMHSREGHKPGPRHLLPQEFRVSHSKPASRYPMRIVAPSPKQVPQFVLHIGVLRISLTGKAQVKTFLGLLHLLFCMTSLSFKRCCTSLALFSGNPFGHVGRSNSKGSS